MRIVLFLVIYLLSLYAKGQTKHGSTDIFEKRAKIYLEETYTKQNIDSAIGKWNGMVLLDVQDIYYQKEQVLSDKLVARNKLKKDYQTFYSLHKDFILLKFDEKGFLTESENPTVYFKYTFKEKSEGKEYIGSSYLYFIFDKELAKWEIWDFRISEVLGDPNRWLQ